MATYNVDLETDSGVIDITALAASGTDVLNINSLDFSDYVVRSAYHDDIYTLVFDKKTISSGSVSYESVLTINMTEMGTGGQGLEEINFGSDLIYGQDLGDWLSGGVDEYSYYSAGDYVGIINGTITSPTVSSPSGVHMGSDSSGSYITVDPNLGNNWISSSHGWEKLHPMIITGFSTWFDSDGVTRHTTVNYDTYVKEITLSSPVSFEDVHINANGDSNGHASLTITIGNSYSFVIPDFEAGKTIDGIGVLDAPFYQQIAHSSSSSIVRGSSSSDFTGTYGGWLSLLYGTVNVTYFFEKLNYGTGSINMQGQLTFNGTEGADSLYGLNARDDIIVGNGGDDNLSAFGGNDILIGGSGDDGLEGGAGIDTANYSTSTAAVTVNLATTSAQDTIGAGIDTITTTENIIGSAYNDTLTGDGNANMIEGGLGNDTINGAGGTDTVSYANASSGVTVSLAITTVQNTVGAGTDTITNVEGIYGSAFNDTLTANASANTIEGGLGNDVMDGAGGTDTLSYSTATASISIDLSLTTAQNTGAAGTDTISNFENVTGSTFNDVIKGSSVANVIDGGLGDDLIYADAGNDTLKGNTGNDTLSFATIASAITVNLATTSAQNTVGAGTDTITGFENVIGSNYNDTITGDGNANIIQGGLGDDTMNGAGGVDTLTYATASSAITINLALTTAQNTGGAGTDTISNFENVVGSAYNDTITGSSAANVIQGGLGDDVMDGAGGVDTVVYSDAASGITLSLALTTAQNTGGGGADTLSNFENVIGTSFNDSIKGSTAANNINAGAGDDIVYGDTGNDTLVGGSGNDTLSFELSTSAITFNLATLTAQATGGAGSDTVSGFENIIGSTKNDTLTGDDFNNMIEGGLGNDTLNGAGGIDTLSYSSAAAGITINLGLTSAQVTGGAGTDTISNFENIFASAFADNLTGDAGSNIINGRGGIDTLTGGLGADRFVFDVAGLGTSDTITDFNVSQGDKLDISNLLFGYDPVSSAIEDFVSFTTYGSNSTLYVDRDGAGTVYSSQAIASLTAVTGLDADTLHASGNLIA